MSSESHIDSLTDEIFDFSVKYNIFNFCALVPVVRSR